jgi:hypothetical protein
MNNNKRTPGCHFKLIVLWLTASNWLVEGAGTHLIRGSPDTERSVDTTGGMSDGILAKPSDITYSYTRDEAPSMDASREMEELEEMEETEEDKFNVTETRSSSQTDWGRRGMVCLSIHFEKNDCSCSKRRRCRRMLREKVGCKPSEMPLAIFNRQVDRTIRDYCPTVSPDDTPAQSPVKSFPTMPTQVPSQAPSFSPTTKTVECLKRVFRRTPCLCSERAECRRLLRRKTDCRPEPMQYDTFFELIETEVLQLFCPTRAPTRSPVTR